MKYFKIKNAFRSLLVSYLAVLMVPLVLVVTMTVIASYYSEESCKKVMQSELLQSKILFENELDNMKSDAMQLSYDNTLKWLMHQDTLQQGDKNVAAIMKFQEKLNSYFLKSTFYHDYAVILSNGYVFRNTSAYMQINSFYEYYRKYSELNYDEWYQKSFYNKGSQLLPMQDITVDKIKEHSLTFNYSIMNLTGASDEANAVVQLLVSEKNIRNIFSQLLTTEKSYIYIYDKNGQCILQLPQADTDNTEVPDVAKMQAGEGSFIKTINSVKQLVVYQKVSSNGLTYVAMLPRDNALVSAFKLRKMSIILLICSILFELGMGFSFSIRYTVPIRNLVNNINKLMVSDSAAVKADTNMKSFIKPINDYEYLEHSVEKLIFANKRMEVSLQERQTHGRNNFFTLLYNGEFQNNDDIINEAQNYGLKLGNVKYCVAMCKSDNYTEKILSYLEENNYENILSYHAPKEEIIVILFWFSQNIKKDSKMDYIVHVKAELEKEVGSILRFGVGRIYSDEVNLPFSYNQALYCLKHIELNGNFTIMDYNEISINRNYQWYPADIEEKLLNATKYGETGVVEKTFYRILDENCKKRHLNTHMEGILISNIMATFLVICSDTMQDKAVDDIMELVSQNSDFEGKIVVLKEQFIKLSSKFANTKDEQKAAYYERLKSYIDENYQNQQLCVTAAAESFSLSESYFSQFFKDVMGDSFSNYLENVRLKHAKYLMLNSDSDLEAVSYMIGYNNSATFRRAFKRVIGISPSAWKSQNHENGYE